MKERTTIALLLAVAVGLLPPAARPEVVSSEYPIKAAFLYNFMKFVEWPAGTFADEQAPLTLGIVGADPFRNILDEAMANKTINNRRIVVKRIPRFEGRQSLAGCHVLFINATGEAQLEEIPAALAGSSVLTIGEGPLFTQRGGIVRFFVVEKKVRFEINIAAAEKAKLKVSSQLLKLATVVGRGETKRP